MPPEVENQVEETVEETTTEADAGTQEASGVEGATAGGEASGEPAPYVPQTKFKYRNPDGEDTEAEFEEWVKPYLSKDTEEKFRDLYSKAFAVDFLKQRRDRERQERAQLESGFKEFQDQIREIVELRDADLGAFFDRVRLPREKVAQWLLGKLEAEEKLKDLPEPMRQMYTNYENLLRENRELRKGVTSARSGGISAASQARKLELDSVLAKPELSQLVTDYDTRRGRAGAFIEQVIREGEWEFKNSGTDITAEEAVKRAIETLALQAQTPSQGVTPNGSVAAPKVVKQAKPVVIPTVGGGNASPMVKRPKSIADLRQLAKAAQEQS